MNPLYYVAHPFGNNDGNREKVEQIIKRLMKQYRCTDFFSPIHASGFAYEHIPYIKGIDWCLNMLKRCDALILCEGWQNSIGCCMEYAFARANNMTIYEVNMNNELIELK